MYKYHCNLSPGERNALFDLSHDEIIIIKKTDKSSSIVVMHHCDYIQEVERQLKNENYYEQLNEDMSENLAIYIKNTVEKIAQKDKKGELNILVTTGARTPQFYVLPKIHKEHNGNFPFGYSGRPIVPACTLIQKIYEGLLMKLCSPMSKISVLVLKILQIFTQVAKCSLCT